MELTAEDRAYIRRWFVPLAGVLAADELAVTARGHRWIAEQPFTLPIARRPLTRACLDWSERRPHVAGALGSALLAWIRAEGWVAPVRGSRALRVTARGARALRDRLGICNVTSHVDLGSARSSSA